MRIEVLNDGSMRSITSNSTGILVSVWSTNAFFLFSFFFFYHLLMATDLIGDWSLMKLSCSDIEINGA